MIVQRMTFNVKMGCTEEAVTWLKGATEAHSGYNHSYRIYTPNIGPKDVVVVEWEYESLEENERLWAGWYAHPHPHALSGKFGEFFAQGGGSEIWNLEE